MCVCVLDGGPASSCSSAVVPEHMPVLVSSASSPYGAEMWADTTEFYKAQLAGFVLQAYYSFVPVDALRE